MAEVDDPLFPLTGEIEAPLVLFRANVCPEWIDEFDHVSFDHYLTISGHANWAFWNWINSPESTIEQRGGHENVIVESTVRYMRELPLGTPIHVTTQLMSYDDKRYLVLNKIWNSGDETLAANSELKCLGFNLNTRRAESWSQKIKDRFELVRGACDRETVV
ncbi:thioesterase family protein [Mesorhizobium sp. M0220]|uniref:thioesterase family protein n=1 Tax=Mesorhizobium sp. M0220 TaxID=2956920 RepID=UPI00333674D9